MLRRLTVVFCSVMICVLIFNTIGVEIANADNTDAWAAFNLNLRASPSTKDTILATLASNTPLVLEARTADNVWLLVHAKGGTERGWSATTFIRLAPGVRISRLQISQEQVIPGSASASGSASDATPVKIVGDGTTVDDTKVPAYAIPVPPIGNIPTGAINAPILPVITARIRGTMRAVFYQGRGLGNNARVFSKVGDCHTDHPAFFNPFGSGQYDLGSYAYLKGVIDYYSVPPRPGTANSFNVKSEAAHSAYNSGAVLDWQSVLDNSCNTGESPLRCEYRLNKPAVAIIMFGVVDVLIMTPEQFNLYMRYIIKDTLALGIVPILSTTAENASNPEKGRVFNQIVVRIAHEKNIPLINLEAALANLPNKGLDADGIHLTRPADVAQTAIFTDANLKYGYTMRNLVTLQALDIVWHQILH